MKNREDMDVNNKNSQIQEQISALMDGECSHQDLHLVLAALRAEKYKSDWEIYHQIGDILKSNQTGVDVSEGFNTRLNAQLSVTSPVVRLAPLKLARHINVRTVYALAAMLALITIMIPRFAGNEGAEVGAPYFAAQFMPANYATQTQPDPIVTAASHKVVGAKADSQPVMLRDPLIDSYLAAHQHYANSMYSAVEYEAGPIIQETGKQ